MIGSKQNIMKSKDKIEKVESLQKKQVKINSSVKYEESHTCRRCKYLGLIYIIR